VPKPEFLVPADLPALNLIPPLPSRGQDGLKSTQVVRTDNFGLLLERFVPYQVIQDGKHDVITDYSDPSRPKVYQTLRNYWLEHCTINYDSQNQKFSDLIANSYKRWKAMTRGASETILHTQGRLVVGLGKKGALDFGLQLHSVTGLPYIPGSALKGLCRVYALYFMAERLQWPIPVDQPIEIQSKVLEEFDRCLTGQVSAAEELAKHKEWPMLSGIYSSMFGTLGQSGHCVFFDGVITSLPSNNNLYCVDVMTPHFSQYYRSEGKSAPSDDDKPIPIPFITVASGIAFAFAIGMRRNLPIDKPLLGNAQHILKAALSELGIGAKTAAGYGVFVDPSPING
jgi:CRISPR-associated protein Cmr6